MRTTLRHPATLLVRTAVLGPVVQAGLQDCASELLSVAALDLLAEQARTSGDAELALARSMESASLREALAGLAGEDAVETCLAALRQRDLDILAAHLCTQVEDVPAAATKATTAA